MFRRVSLLVLIGLLAACSESPEADPQGPTTANQNQVIQEVVIDAASYGLGLLVTVEIEEQEQAGLPLAYLKEGLADSLIGQLNGMTAQAVEQISQEWELIRRADEHPLIRGLLQQQHNREIEEVKSWANLPVPERERKVAAYQQKKDLQWVERAYAAGWKAVKKGKAEIAKDPYGNRKDFERGIYDRLLGGSSLIDPVQAKEAIERRRKELEILRVREKNQEKQASQRERIKQSQRFLSCFAGFQEGDSHSISTPGASVHYLAKGTGEINPGPYDTVSLWLRIFHAEGHLLYQSPAERYRRLRLETPGVQWMLSWMVAGDVVQVGQSYLRLLGAGAYPGEEIALPGEAFVVELALLDVEPADFGSWQEQSKEFSRPLSSRAKERMRQFPIPEGKQKLREWANCLPSHLKLAN